MPSTMPSSARPCKNPVRQLSKEPCSANWPMPTVYSPSASSTPAASVVVSSDAASAVVSAAVVSAAVVSAVLLPHPANAIIAAIAAAITFTLFLIIFSSCLPFGFSLFSQLFRFFTRTTFFGRMLIFPTGGSWNKKSLKYRFHSVFETNSLNPRYHSNWFAPTHPYTNIYAAR